jgi:hypothetical protein
MAEAPQPEEVRPGMLVVDASGLDPEVARRRLEQALRRVHDEGLECVAPDRL